MKDNHVMYELVLLTVLAAHVKGSPHLHFKNKSKVYYSMYKMVRPGLIIAPVAFYRLRFWQCDATNATHIEFERQQLSRKSGFLALHTVSFDLFLTGLG